MRALLRAEPSGAPRAPLVLVWTTRAWPERRVSPAFQAALAAAVAPLWRVEPFTGEGLAVRAQAAAFARADAVLGVTGAALANLVFAPAHSALLFIPSAPVDEGYYAALAAALRLGALIVLGDAATSWSAPAPVTERWCGHLVQGLDLVSRARMGEPTRAPAGFCAAVEEPPPPPPCAPRGACLAQYAALGADGAPSEAWWRGVEAALAPVRARIKRNIERSGRTVSDQFSLFAYRPDTEAHPPAGPEVFEGFDDNGSPYWEGP